MTPSFPDTKKIRQAITRALSNGLDPEAFSEAVLNACYPMTPSSAFESMNQKIKDLEKENAEMGRAYYDRLRLLESEITELKSKS